MNQQCDTVGEKIKCNYGLKKLEKPNLKYYVHYWISYFKKDAEKLKMVKGQEMKVMKGLEGKV